MTLKHRAIQPANNLFPRAQPDLFGGMPNMLDSSNPPRQDLIFIPDTPRRRERRCGLQQHGSESPTLNMHLVFSTSLAMRCGTNITSRPNWAAYQLGLWNWHEQSFWSFPKYVNLTSEASSLVP
uniref:E3 ubiquitin-protein ligase CCNB1IP1-like protein n=1 Tax=Saccharum spontaneum TaxID=62335 RepID=A0A678TQF8_SACSP